MLFPGLFCAFSLHSVTVVHSGIPALKVLTLYRVLRYKEAALQQALLPLLKSNQRAIKTLAAVIEPSAVRSRE